MFRALLFISLFLMASFQLFAENKPQEIIANHSSELGLYYVHMLHPKETVYSLSKFTNTSVQEIYDLNGINKNTVLSIGQTLRIPINATTVLQTKKSMTAHKLVKVYYRVKKKDNLFQIAKRYFETEINTLRQLNQLQDLTISPGQLLHIGWMLAPNNVTIERIESEDILTARAVNTSAIATSPTRTTTHTTTQTSYQKSENPRSTTEYHSITPVANTPVNASEVKHQYRVVQHTPLRKNQTTSQTQTQQTTTVLTQPTVEVKEEVAVVQSQTQVTSAPVYQQSKTTVSTNTPVETTIVSAPQSDSQPVVTETTIVTTSPNNSVSSSVRMETTKGETASNTDSKYTVKKREYPDLSFLTDPSLQVEKAVASWDKTDNEPLNMFVLHHSAKINSYVRVENPMLGRIALAKVIGRLPTNIQDPQIKMIVSTAVANSLGVKDEKFLTEIKFVQ